MILLLILQLPVIVLISYLLNKQKIYSRSGNIYITSFFEGLGTYLTILSLILGSFVPNLMIRIILLVVGFTIIAFTKNYINDAESEMDLQLETMKNLIVLFSSTLLLFYVMLSVFRFQPFFLQFLYALLIVIFFNFISIFMKRWFSKLWDQLYSNNSMFVSFNAIYTYIGLFIIFLMVVFINFPKVSVNKALNLNNSNSYFVHSPYLVGLDNRYKTDLLINVDMDLDLDWNAFMNQDDEYIFINIDNELYIHDTLIIFDLSQGEIIYSDIYQENINGINVPSNNEETNEVNFKSSCSDNNNCNEYTYPYTYGEVKYKTSKVITKFENLEYKHSNSAIYNNHVLHFFEDEKIDSKVSISDDKPLLGFGESKAIITDVDQYDGMILYLQVEKNDQLLNIKVNRIIEKDIDLDLPFYSHYRFGMLVFIFVLGFIPISNYDKDRAVVQ